MEYGLFTSGYQRVGLERAFSDAAAFGYDFIELWGGRPHAYAPDLLSGGLAELRRLMERYAMPVRVYTPEHNAYPYNYMLGSDTQWADCVSYLSDAIRAGASLGAEYTLISVGHGGGAPYPATATATLTEDGRIAGQAPCNSFNANYVGRWPDLSFESVATTRATCPEIEAEGLFFATIIA